jgi:hypothetical protein
MKRNPMNVAIATLLLAGVALAGCNKNDANDTAMGDDTTTPAATDTTADMPPATTDTTGMDDTGATSGLTVTTVDLGSAVGTDNRISTPSTSFASGDTIHASIATDGNSAGTLTAKWTFQDGQVVDTQEKSVPAGPQVTDFSITKPDGWPAGTYKLEISNNGMVVQTREFDVQ